MLTMEQVIEKTQLELKKAISKLGSRLPIQEKEEITQKVILKFIEKFKSGELSQDLNWEGLISKSVRGYVKNHNRDRRNERAVLSSAGDDFGIEAICDEVNFKEHEDPEAAFSDPINWSLLKRLCSVDKELRVFVLFNILEFTLMEINEFFGRSSEKRIADMNYDFMSKLLPVDNDNPIVKDQWMKQVLFALGISRLYGLEPIDQGIGWGLDSFEFSRPQKTERLSQGLFDFMNEKVG